MHANKPIFLFLILGIFLAEQIWLPTLAFAGPLSSSFELKEYSFGSGGTSNSTSGSFSLFGTAGDVDGGKLSSATFKSGNGLTFEMTANVPPAPTFTNPSSYYNKLKIVLNQGGNAADAKYAIAISSDNFVADTKYVQSDNTVGATLGTEDWQTYTTWGGGTGVNIIGLAINTTYTVKVSAKKGNFTQSPYGPTAQAATIGPTMTFDIDVSSTDSETAAPYSVSIGNLTPATVVTSTNKIWVDLSTNGTSGGTIYVNGSNNGLTSSRASYTISAVSNDLSSAITQGYGARSSSTNQSSGGPIQAIAPYNGASNNVGLLDTSKRVIFDSTNQPVVSGRASFELKAKASSTTPAATDYSDTLTIIASSGF
jgi:hypothetical protein